MPTERDLIANAAHDPEAFRALYRAYFPRVYAYVGYRVNSSADAEDVTSEVFLKVVKSISGFEYRGEGAFAAWIFRIAHNAVSSYYRAKGGQQDFSLDDVSDLAGDEPLPDQSLLQAEQIAQLRAHVKALSPRKQEIITLKFFGGLRNAEIAVVLGLDERTIAVHLCRAVQDLQRLYTTAEEKLMNEIPDKNLLDQINQRVHQGQASGDPIIDGLGASAPHANPVFQQRLEDELMGYFQTDGEREVNMTTITPARQAAWSKRPVLPLTLVAALIALVFVASVLTFANRPDSNAGIVAAQISATPVPNNTIRIVVAYQNLPRGYQFPSTLEEVSKLAGYVEWPVEAIPFNALGESEDGLSQLAGRYLVVDIVREQPIMLNMLSDGMPLTDLAYAESLYRNQQWQDIQAELDTLQQIYDGQSPEQQAIMAQRIQELKARYVEVSASEPLGTAVALGAVFPTGPMLVAVVIAKIDLPAGTQITNPDEQLAVVYWPVELSIEGKYQYPADLVNSYLQHSISKWQPVLNTDVQTEAPAQTAVPTMILPDDKVAVTIPTHLIASVPYRFEVGDLVDIQADIIFVDVDPQFQALPGATVMFVTPSSQSQEVIVSPTPTRSATPANYQHIVQLVATGVEVLDIQVLNREAVVTVAVSPQEAVVLTWAIEAGGTLNFSLSTEAEGTPEATANP